MYVVYQSFTSTIVTPIILTSASILIILGAALMGLSIFKTRQILTLFKNKKDRQGWEILSSLMIFFLGGYSVALWLVQHNLTDWIIILTGIIFFFGSLFVLLSVHIYHITLLRLMETQEKYREARETAEVALEKLKASQLQLIQQEKMSYIGNLVAGIAHEINNPVSFILGNIDPAVNYIKDLFRLIDIYQSKFPENDSEIAEKFDSLDLEFLKDDLLKLIESMKKGGNILRDISVSLRIFSRNDNDMPIVANIHDGIDSTLVILKHRLKANKLRPAIIISKNYGELPLVECFFGQLNQVFINILSNAIDALEESNQKRSFADIETNPNCIIIETQFTENTERIRIIIKDNGIGMSPEVKDKIFNYLFTTKTVGKGTGLGLNLAHQIIVDKHHGMIDVNSVLGEGTEFIITIPVKVVIPS